MACSRISEDESSSDFVVCEMCTDVQEATNHCYDCLANFCDSCTLAHEKMAKGPKEHHVERGVYAFDLELELCPKDGEKMSFYCRSCRQRVCPECELKTCRHVLHSVVSLNQHINQEKERLLDRLDHVTSKTETISYMPADIKTLTTQIELKWLERRDQIQQEFASLYETITTQQHKLLAEMEEEVKASLQCLNEMQQKHDQMMSSACQLSDDCVSAVQNLPRSQFMKSYPQFLGSVGQLEKEMSQLDAGQDMMPSFLQLPFSLHKEKLGLHNCLQLATFNCRNIRARQQIRFISQDQLRDEMNVSMLLETPGQDCLPPSTCVRYTADVYFGAKHSKPIPASGHGRLLKASDSVINGCHGYRLLPGSLYMVKLCPTIICISHVGLKKVKGKVISIIIVTDVDPGFSDAGQLRMVAGDNQEEEDACSLSSTVPAGNTNNSARAISSSSHRRQNCSSGHSSKTCASLTSAFPPSYTAASFYSRVSRMCDGQPWYRCAVPMSAADRSFTVDPEAKGVIRCHRRYLATCSFEEARLMEDCNLNLSRIVIFDH